MGNTQKSLVYSKMTTRDRYYEESLPWESLWNLTMISARKFFSHWHPWEYLNGHWGVCLPWVMQSICKLLWHMASLKDKDFFLCQLHCLQNLVHLWYICSIYKKIQVLNLLFLLFLLEGWFLNRLMSCFLILLEAANNRKHTINVLAISNNTLSRLGRQVLKLELYKLQSLHLHILWMRNI